MNFKGKNVLITGASRGLGEALARQIGALGANLILLDRNDQPFCTIADDLGKQGVHVDCYKCDVTDQDSIDTLFATVQDHHGTVDVLINNAGILNTWGFQNSFAEFERMMDVNVLGYARMLLTFMPILGRPMTGKKARFKQGMVIFILSIGGLVIAPNLQFYGVSKAASIAMASALRQHFLINNQKYMKVLDVRPPQFDTQLYVESDLDAWIKELRAKGKLPTPERFASMIIKAAQKDAQDVNLTFLGKVAAFGAKFFPGTVLYFSRRYYQNNQKKAVKLDRNG
jgi:NAD(P)-dependent dehydrogenase (short-subunit alcohol dehydrogenase family)